MQRASTIYPKAGHVGRLFSFQDREITMLHYNHNNGQGMNKAQRDYRRVREQLRTEPMVKLIRVLIQPNAEFVSPEAGSVSMLRADQVTMTVVTDLPRAGDSPNRRLYQQGKIEIQENEAMPWRPRVSLVDETVCDLAAGVSCRVQISQDCTTEDTILSPKAGTVNLIEDGSSVFVCVGNYHVDNEIRPLRVVRLATKDLANVRILNCHIYGLVGNPGTLRVGRAKQGEALVTFDRPIKVEMAQFGLGQEPLLRDNLKYAVPAEGSIAMARRAAEIAKFSDAKAVTMSSGFSVLEAGYTEDLAEAGISGTQWSPRQAALLGAGQHLGFALPVDILFPGDGVIASITEGHGGKRVRLTMEDGREYSYPSSVVLTVRPGHCDRYTPIGTWTTPAGRPLPEKQLTQEDVLAILWDAAQQQGYFCEVGDSHCLLAPHGLLGSLAIKDSQAEGMSDHYLCCEADLWDEKLKGFLLPSMTFAEELWLGNAQFEVTVAEAGEVGMRPARRPLIRTGR